MGIKREIETEKVSFYCVISEKIAKNALRSFEFILMWKMAHGLDYFKRVIHYVKNYSMTDGIPCKDV